MITLEELTPSMCMTQMITQKVTRLIRKEDSSREYVNGEPVRPCLKIFPLMV